MAESNLDKHLLVAVRPCNLARFSFSEAFYWTEELINNSWASVSSSVREWDVYSWECMCFPLPLPAISSPYNMIIIALLSDIDIFSSFMMSHFLGRRRKRTLIYASFIRQEKASSLPIVFFSESVLLSLSYPSVSEHEAWSLFPEKDPSQRVFSVERVSDPFFFR